MKSNKGEKNQPKKLLRKLGAGLEKNKFWVFPTFPIGNFSCR